MLHLCYKTFQKPLILLNPTFLKRANFKDPVLIGISFKVLLVEDKKKINF